MIDNMKLGVKDKGDHLKIICLAINVCKLIFIEMQLFQSLI